MSASIRIGPYVFDHISYDEEGDVLYLSVGEPQEAVNCEETPEGHVIRSDRDEHIIGVSIVNAKWILDHDQAVALTLPKQSTVAGPAGQVQLEPSALLAEIIPDGRYAQGVAARGRRPPRTELGGRRTSLPNHNGPGQSLID